MSDAVVCPGHVNSTNREDDRTIFNGSQFSLLITRDRLCAIWRSLTCASQRRFLNRVETLLTIGEVIPAD